MTIQTLTYLAGERTVSFKMDLDPTCPSDRWIIDADMHRVPYEADIVAIMFRAIKEGDTVVDVGANVGYFTCLMAALVGPTGKVYSFEPASENLHKLCKNIALNEFINVVRVVSKVAWDREGFGDLYISADDSGGNALWDPAKWHENVKSQRHGCDRETVEATTLDAVVVDRSRLSFIKIDTEGCEVQVLKGAQYILRQCRPTVVAELSHFALSQMGETEATLRGLMFRHCCYDTFLSYRTGDLPKLVPIGTRICIPHNVNLLFSTTDKVSELWPEVTG